MHEKENVSRSNCAFLHTWEVKQGIALKQAKKQNKDLKHSRNYQLPNQLNTEA